VQYLQKYSPEAKAQLELLRTSHDSMGMNMDLVRDGLYVKKTGSVDWLKITDPKARKLLVPVAPEGMGTETPKSVSP
jgi:hypothetical protein